MKTTKHMGGRLDTTALNACLAQALGKTFYVYHGTVFVYERGEYVAFMPTANWVQIGPLIEAFDVNIEHEYSEDAYNLEGRVKATVMHEDRGDNPNTYAWAETPQEAVVRALVGYMQGDDIDLDIVAKFTRPATAA